MHTIVEAHPDVLSMMQDSEGGLKKSYEWLNKPSVVIKAGKWQDVVPCLIQEQSALSMESAATTTVAATSSSGSQHDYSTNISHPVPIDAIFYDTHDEGVPAFLSIAISSAKLLRTTPSNNQRSSEILDGAVSSGTRPRRCFSFWNGSKCVSVSLASLSLDII
jgi:hypothetical protein